MRFAAGGVQVKNWAKPSPLVNETMNPCPRAGIDRRLVTGNSPVRFDEREVETEHGVQLLRHGRRNPEPEYVEANPTAPPLDSTSFRS